MIRKKHGRQGAGLIFPIYLYRKKLKIFLTETTGPISIVLCRNIPLVILYRDLFQAIMIGKKNMAARGRGLFWKISDVGNR